MYRDKSPIDETNQQECCEEEKKEKKQECLNEFSSKL